MEQKRDIPRHDQQRARRKKRRRTGGNGDPARSPTQGDSRPGHLRGKPPTAPKRDDRRQGKNSSTPAGGGAPRDLRTGSTKGDQKTAAPPFQHVTKRYGVIFFESFPAAKAARDAIAQEAAQVDQLNIVIKAEGNMDDPEVLDIVPRPGALKIFAGAAWTLIHERRVQDGWYQEPR